MICSKDVQDAHGLTRHEHPVALSRTQGFLCQPLVANVVRTRATEQRCSPNTCTCVTARLPTRCWRQPGQAAPRSFLDHAAVRERGSAAIARWTDMNQSANRIPAWERELLRLA